tara:strand:+ start:901 stop:1158 length:258 start_codon:yes stop_codon:yes gene_type:complete
MSRPKTLPQEIVELLNAQERAISYALRHLKDDQDFMLMVTECWGRWRMAGANGYKYKNGKWKVMRDMPKQIQGEEKNQNNAGNQS